MITNDLLMQFLCIIISNLLPVICQSASFIYYIAHIVAIAFITLPILICCTNVLPIITNLTQSLTYSVYQWLLIICQYIITNHSIGKFLHIGSQYFTNHQFANDTGKFTNSYQWFTIGSYWQWYTGSLFVWFHIKVDWCFIEWVP